FTPVHLGRHWVKVSSDQLAELRALRSRLSLRTTGMVESNRRRLRQFDDPANVKALLHLPQRLMEKAMRIDRGGIQEAIIAQSAVAIAILLAAPLRIRALVNLNRDVHLICSRPPHAVAYLMIPPELIKNQTSVEFVVPPRVVNLLDQYWEQFRPRLVRAQGA